MFLELLSFKIKKDSVVYIINHKNYNFLDCDWFENSFFP